MKQAVHVEVKDEQKVLSRPHRRALMGEVRSILSRYTRLFKHAHVTLHVKTVSGKNLTKAILNLSSDKGRIDTSAEGWDVESTVQECLNNMRTILQKQQGKLVDRWTAQKATI